MIGGVGHESQNGNQEYLNVLAIFPNLKILQGHNSPENKENIFFWKLASGNSKYGKINILFAVPKYGWKKVQERWDATDPVQQRHQVPKK